MAASPAAAMSAAILRTIASMSAIVSLPIARVEPSVAAASRNAALTVWAARRRVSSVSTGRGSIPRLSSSSTYTYAIPARRSAAT
jgi:hypothetical protein